MISVAEAILAFAWVFGVNGFLIERQLTDVEALPIAWLEPVTDHASITFHAREDWAMAFYVAGHASGATSGRASGATPAPGPRLVLYAPYYLAPGGLPTVSGMPVDVAEYYFHALIEAALDLDPDETSYAGRLDERAAELMTDVPPAHRLPAYTSALADFGAHLLAVRNEISRLAERQAAVGRDLCRHLDQPASLFGLWHRSIAGGTYAGSYFVPDGDGLPHWAQSRQALERSDKDRFLEELFGVVWSGDPKQDFAVVCPNL